MSENPTQTQDTKKMQVTFEMVCAMSKEQKVAYAQSQIQKLIDAGIIDESGRQRQMESFFPTRQSEEEDNQRIRDYRRGKRSE
jgi:hypothetical protein